MELIIDNNSTVLPAIHFQDRRISYEAYSPQSGASDHA